MFILGGSCSEYAIGSTTAFALVFGALPLSAVAERADAISRVGVGDYASTDPH